MTEETSEKTDRNNRGFRDDLKRIGTDAIAIKQDVAGLGRDLSQTARSGMTAAKEEVNRGLEAAKEQGKNAVESISQLVTERPLTSIGVAVGVGLLIGMVLRPRA